LHQNTGNQNQFSIFLQILSFMPRLVFAIPNTIGAYEPVLLRGSAGQAFLSTPALLQVPGQTSRNFGAQLLLGTASRLGMNHAVGWNMLWDEICHKLKRVKQPMLRAFSFHMRLQI
jgi:hypothetical protein